MSESIRLGPITNALHSWASGNLSASKVHSLLRGYGYKADLRKGFGASMPIQTLDGKKEFLIPYFKKGGFVTKAKAKKRFK